jgi:hypothetical protein
MKKWLIFFVILILIVAGVYFYNVCKPKNDPASFILEGMIVPDYNDGLFNLRFYEGQRSIIFNLGSNNLAKIVPGSGEYHILLAAIPINDSNVMSVSDMQYNLSFRVSEGDCISELGLEKTKSLLITPLDQWNDFENFNNDLVVTTIKFKIPKGTSDCSQLVVVELRENGFSGPFGETIAGSSFTFEIHDNWVCSIKF